MKNSYFTRQQMLIFEITIKSKNRYFIFAFIKIGEKVFQNNTYSTIINCVNNEQDFLHSCFSLNLMMRAGTPPTIAPGGTSFVTTAPAAITPPLTDFNSSADYSSSTNPNIIFNNYFVAIDRL